MIVSNTQRSEALSVWKTYDRIMNMAQKARYRNSGDDALTLVIPLLSSPTIRYWQASAMNKHNLDQFYLMYFVRCALEKSQTIGGHRRTETNAFSCSHQVLLDVLP